MTQVELYLIRHEESEMNTRRYLVCGRSDETPLTERGESRAAMLGKYMHELGMWPDVVYTSPAARARQTGAGALRQLGYVAEPFVDEDLHEVSQGAWEGRVREEVYPPDVVERILEDPENFAAPGGESINDAHKRMTRFLGRLASGAEQADQPLTAFAFTHGYSTAILVGKMLGWSTDEMRDRERTPNGSLTVLRYEDRAWSVVGVGKNIAEFSTIKAWN